MTRDTLFDEPRKPVAPFAFNRSVAAVFDDMIRRSVPLYDELLTRQAQLIDAYFQDGTRIYDLGCSTGNLGLRLCETMGDRAFEMIAVDNAAPMLDVCAAKLAAAGANGRIRLRQEDIGRIDLEGASVVVLNFTLQFLPPANRAGLLARIFEGLLPGGILLLAEKIIHADDEFNHLQEIFYHRLKKENGYSDLAVSQKREALEKVLVPDTEAVHRQRIHAAGFIRSDIWLKWFNFCAWICQK